MWYVVKVKSLWYDFYNENGADHVDGMGAQVTLDSPHPDKVVALYSIDDGDTALLSLDLEYYPDECEFEVGYDPRFNPEYDNNLDPEGYVDKETKAIMTSRLNFSCEDAMFGKLTQGDITPVDGDLEIHFGCNLVKFPLEYPYEWIEFNPATDGSFDDFVYDLGGLSDWIEGDFEVSYGVATSGQDPSPVNYVDAYLYYAGEDEDAGNGMARCWFYAMVPVSVLNSQPNITFFVRVDMGRSFGVQEVAIPLSDPKLLTPGQKLTLMQVPAGPPTFSVTYEDRESTGLSLPPNTSVEEGSPLTEDMLPELSKDGYRFLGWFIDGGDERATPGYTPTASIVLVPRIEVIKILVTYSDPDGTGIELPGEVNVDMGYQLTEAELPERESPSYEFLGWYRKGTDEKLDVGYEVVQPLEIQPKAVMFHHVSYTGLEDTSGLADQDDFYVRPGEPIPQNRTPDLDKVAYRFTGWLANGAPIASDGSYVPQGDVVLSPSFTTITGIPSEMQIQYNTQVDAWVADSPVRLSGLEPTKFQALPLSLVPVRRDGFTQIGWLMDFSGTAYVGTDAHVFTAEKSLPLTVLTEDDFTLTPGSYEAVPETSLLDDLPVSGYIPDAQITLTPVYLRDSVAVLPPEVFPALDYCDAETPLAVTLKSPTPGVRIFYTLDGSNPADIEEDNPAYNPDGSTPNELPKRVRPSALSVANGQELPILCTDTVQVHLRAVAYLPWQIPSGEGWGLYTPRETDFLVDHAGGASGSETIGHVSGLEPYKVVVPPYKHGHRFLGYFATKEPPIGVDDVMYWDSLGHPVKGEPLKSGPTPVLYARWENTGECSCHDCQLERLERRVGDIEKKTTLETVEVVAITGGPAELAYLDVLVSGESLERVRYDVTSLPVSMELYPTGATPIYGVDGKGGYYFYSGLYDGDTKTLSLMEYAKDFDDGAVSGGGSIGHLLVNAPTRLRFAAYSNHPLKTLLNDTNLNYATVIFTDATQGDAFLFAVPLFNQTADIWPEVPLDWMYGVNVYILGFRKADYSNFALASFSKVNQGTYVLLSAEYFNGSASFQPGTVSTIIPFIEWNGTLVYGAVATKTYPDKFHKFIFNTSGITTMYVSQPSMDDLSFYTPAMFYDMASGETLSSSLVPDMIGCNFMHQINQVQAGRHMVDQLRDNVQASQVQTYVETYGCFKITT